ncbi:ArdC family protein [Fastidiosibacter lacustris]|uniref:ArdC family protein n=1 Tax=Fastidiosibacter lacustris TaxID=2056695 RepID=UPI000E34E805|nr:zincin-like metallopeptidase domain-containing protein [Fastidiosibacter lacustris]
MTTTKVKKYSTLKTSKTVKTTYQDYVLSIAQKIKENIKKGADVWVDNFDRSGSQLLPVNSQSKLYNGVNVLQLLFSQLENKYKSNQWFTFKQINELGGSVRKGEKSEEVFFFTTYKKEGDAKTDYEYKNNGHLVKVKAGDKYKYTAICPKMYRVFNLTQTTLKDVDQEIKTDSGIESLINAHNPKIVHHDIGQAYYSPELDEIRLPSPKYFRTEADYQATLLHELAHWTLHPSRLNREINFSCKKSYAKEELIAEISSTILLKHFGINGEIKNHEKYIESWLSLLTDDDYMEAVKCCVKVFSFLLNINVNDQYEKVT